MSTTAEQPEQSQRTDRREQSGGAMQPEQPAPTPPLVQPETAQPVEQLAPPQGPQPRTKRQAKRRGTTRQSEPMPGAEPQPRPAGVLERLAPPITTSGLPTRNGTDGPSAVAASDGPSTVAASNGTDGPSTVAASNGTDGPSTVAASAAVSHASAGAASNRVSRAGASAASRVAAVEERDGVAALPEPDGDPFALLAEVPPNSAANMRLLQTVPSALAALRANKGRSILTTLGIIIGVAAVIAIVALGEGATASVANQLAGLGTNLLTIQPGSTQSGGARTGAGNAITLRGSDADAITQNVQGLTGVSPVVAGNAQIIAGSQNWSTRVQAVAPVYLTIESWTIAQGAAFTEQDNTNSSNVAVLGDTVYTNLFPNGQSPIGQIIRVRNVPFTVVGVLAAKGTTAGPGGDQDDTVLIPFQTGQVRLFGAQNINQIIVQVGQASQIDAATTDMTTLLRQRHKLTTNQPADFTIRNNNDIISRVSSVSSTMTLLLGGVAAVSLVVGGIGIMNIMLVSVTERTREIGIRLAIGAQPGDVLAQFLVEAIVLSVLGGVIGIGLGAAVALLLPVLAGFATVLPWNAIALSFGVSAAIGMFFGIYPARKASQLDPIVALRYE